MYVAEVPLKGKARDSGLTAEKGTAGAMSAGAATSRWCGRRMRRLRRSMRWTARRCGS